MKRFSGLLSAAALAAGLALAAAPAMAQQQLPPMPKVKQSTPAAIAAAKEILTMKNVAVMYSGAVPGIIEKTKTGLLQQYLNYQKDLDEVAVIVAKQFAESASDQGAGIQRVILFVGLEQAQTDRAEQLQSQLLAQHGVLHGQRLAANQLGQQRIRVVDTRITQRRAQCR